MTITMNENNKEKMSGFDIFSHPVPELTEEQISSATSVENKSWILSCMGEKNLGRFEMVEGAGFALQNVGRETLRCIFSFDDGPAILFLAMVKETIESVGGALELGDFTVLREYIEPEPEDSTEDSIVENPPAGMEVA